jgi:hypothetical protein
MVTFATRSNESLSAGTDSTAGVLRIPRSDAGKGGTEPVLNHPKSLNTHFCSCSVATKLENTVPSRLLVRWQHGKRGTKTETGGAPKRSARFW